MLGTNKVVLLLNTVRNTQKTIFFKKGGRLITYGLSIGLIMWIDHRKEIRKLTFRALALRRSEPRGGWKAFP